MSEDAVDTKVGLPALAQILGDLPELPKHYNPINALSKEDKSKLLDLILAHYENGASIYELAEKLGVNNATLYRSLVKHRQDEWVEVRGARYHAEVEDAEKEMKAATDPLAVTRARERLANARWMLERLQRKIYGQDIPVDRAAGISISINLRGKTATIAAHNESVTVDQDGKVA